MRKYNLSQFYNTHIFILIPMIMVYDYLSFSSYLHINIFIIIGVNYSVEGKEGGGGGGGWHSWEFLMGVCLPVLQILSLYIYFRPKNVIFPTRFQTWPLRKHLDKNSNKKDFLKAFLNSHTSLSFLLIWNWNDKYVHTVL